MGGSGSGRHWQFGADTTDNYRSIDIRWLKREGLLESGVSRSVFVSSDSMRRLGEWISTSGLDADAPLFIPLSHAATQERLSGDDIARMLKRRAGRAGVSAENISGHSTRVGAAQDMRACGLENGAIMQAGRWQSERMVARYTERLGARYGAAAKLAELQGRT